MTTTYIEVGASRITLLKLAADIQATFAKEGEYRDMTLYAHENSSAAGEVQIRFSNEDMEGRDDIAADAVFVEIETEED